MAVRSKSNYKSTKDLIITTNGVGDISGSDVNSTFEDSADSFVFNNGTSTISSATWDGSYTSTSGVDTNLTIQPTVNQASGTGGSTAVKINVITTTLGSGVHNILQLQDTGTDKFLVDVNGTVTVTNKIVSISNGNIDIEPNGTGNVLLGNFTFDADQTVGAGQDNFVLTFDNGTGLISLEAAAGGSGAFTADGDTQITETTPILLDQATGDEVALSISPTINKATSGNYTAIKVNVTETAAPGSSDLLIDLQVGASSVFEVDNSGSLTAANDTDLTMNYGRCRIDSRVTDTVNISHVDQLSTPNYNIRITAAGDMTLNAPATKSIVLAISNSAKWLWDLNGNQIGQSTVTLTVPGKLFASDRIAFGLTTGDVATPLEGEFWYNNTANKFRVDEGGVLKDVIHIETINVTLTQGQIQALNTTPIEIIPAPGTGKYIEIVLGSAFLDHNGTTYAVASNLIVKNTDVDWTAISLIDDTADTVKPLDRLTLTGGIEIGINGNVTITADADATGAGGTIKVSLSYVIRETA